MESSGISGAAFQRPSAWEIALAFLHLGVTAYGGLAMIEPIRQRVVQEKEWLSQREFLDGVALCQILPGATMVPLATHVGYRLRKTTEAVAAAAAFILPAFFLMLGLSFLYFKYGEVGWVKPVSRGLAAVVIALLLQAWWRLEEIIRQPWLNLLIALMALGALWIGVHYLLVFLTAGCLRLVLGLKFSPPQGSQMRESSGPTPKTGLILAEIVAAVVVVAILVWGLGKLEPVMGLMTLIFFKIGGISFGGGYAMIPILQWDMVDHLGWLSLRQFLDGILLGFITPGPIIITAAFVGYKIHGLLGAIAATVSIFLPPILLIIFLTPFYQRIKEVRVVRPAIQGILAALVGMLVLVIIQMSRGAYTDWRDLALMLGTAVALIGFRMNLLLAVAIVACLSRFIFAG